MIIFFSFKQFLILATVCDNDVLLGGAGLRPKRLDLPDDIQALADLTEHDVLSVKPVGLGGAEKKLAPISVGTSIGH